MTYVTQDSGERSEFGSGMVRDTDDGKPRFDLIMPLNLPFRDRMLTRWAELMARGAGKYGDRNWEKADSQEELDRFAASAFRHFMQWYHGVEDGEDHAAAVFFNISAAEYVKRKLAEKEPPPAHAIRFPGNAKIEIIPLDPGVVLDDRALDALLRAVVKLAWRVI